MAFVEDVVDYKASCRFITSNYQHIGSDRKYIYVFMCLMDVSINNASDRLSFGVL